MLKILLKTILLVFIILSIYFIVNPSACSNLMMGRVTNITDTQAADEILSGSHGEMFVPAGDRPLQDPQPAPAQQAAQPETDPEVEGITDTNTLKELETPTYSQEDMDYAIASRYVELEKEYAQQNKSGKDTAKEISYRVMDDFELTQQEWEAFLERATASNLFNKIRTELAEKK